MRSFMIAGLILLAAPQLRAQDSLPRFAFEGHRVGETRSTQGPRTECEHPATGQTVCIREVLDEVSFDAYYTYNHRGRLSHVDVKADSLDFEPLLIAFSTRYGHPRTLRRGKGHEYAQWRFREGRLHLTRTGTVVVAQFAATR